MSRQSGGTRSVYMHVGEPKTGTTFLQQVMWANKAELLEQGVLLPGPRPMAHWRAAQDLRDVRQFENDPVGPNKGAWDRLARQALRAPRVAVISHELLAEASEEQAGRAVRSLEPAEVHVILTVRDFATLIPAEWQETIKHRNKRAWDDWVADIIDRESPLADRRRFLFWRMHDTLEILRIWSAQLAPERVHVITVPPRGSAPGLLWERYAGVLGVDPAAADLAVARSNVSLGLAEVELLRRVNAALPREVPGWFYMRNVKSTLAHGVLAQRPSTLGRLELPPERHQWAVQHAKGVIEALRESSYDVVGDLDELLPPPPGEIAASPADVPAEQMLDAAVTSITALLAELGKTQGIEARPDEVSAPRPHGRVKAAVLRLSERSRTVHRLRRAYWHVANAARHLRSTARPAPSAGEELTER
jgi:hypothetical protein